MLSKFRTNINECIKEYNKKNKSSPIEEFTEEKVNELIKQLEILSLMDVVYRDKNLHHALLPIIGDIYNVSKKFKLKGKVLENFIKDVEFLPTFLKAYYNEEEFKEDSKTIPYFSLFDNPDYARSNVDKWLNLLVSKSVDYLPAKTTEKQLQPFVDVLNQHHSWLNDLIDMGYHKLTYVVTENFHYMPLNMSQLNSLNKFGSIMEKWVDESAEHPLLSFLQKNGYDGFFGWGNLSNFSGDKPQVKNISEAKEKDGLKTLFLDNKGLESIAKDVFSYTWMFACNNNFQLANREHFSSLIFTMAAIIAQRLPAGYTLNRATTLKILEIIKTYANKSQKLSVRKDRKYWFTKDKFLEPLFTNMESYSKNKDAAFTVILASHALDLSTPVTGINYSPWEETANNHHGYLARSHNVIFYPNPESELSSANKDRMINYYTKVIKPLFTPLAEPSQEWLFNASLEFVFNIENEDRAKVGLDFLLKFFSIRHTREEVEKFKESDQWWYKFMSYNTKAKFLELWEKADKSDIKHYAGSKECLEYFIDIVKEDLENPIRDCRTEKHVQITEDAKGYA